MIEIEPSKRRYDDAERERLVELFGEPERWASTTSSLRWAQAQALVPSFTGSTRFGLELPCTYDHEVGATKYFNGLSGGEAPLRFHFNGTVIWEDDDGRMQLTQVPWDCSARFEMPVEVWRTMIEASYPFRGWIAARRGDDRAPRATSRPSRALPTFDATVAELLDGLGEAGLMEKALESLLDSLLYEGYALYPYTPGATKNATPTPFGIVYPPAYAEEQRRRRSTTCGWSASSRRAPRPTLAGTIRFLTSEGERHKAAARRIELPPTPLAELIEDGRGEEFVFEGEETIAGRVRMRAERVGDGLARVKLCVHNTTDARAGAPSSTATRRCARA